MKKFLFFIALLSSCSGVKQEEIVSSNCIEILLDDDIETVVKKAAYIVPTDRQYSWQQLEFTAFVHFGINTFTGKEWGTGKEDIALFKPQNLDANQWVKVARSGGMKLVMLTAKHHDGFCLWQTQTTEYSVKNTPWKNGKGDVLRELAEAVKKENLKLGVYLSPADLHELEREGGTYGNGSKPTLRKIPSSPDLQAKADTIFSYELDDYNAFFMNQLYEVLTQYGEISEVWFDGANPKQGTGQEYDYAAWHDMIRHLQPSAVIAIKGPDVRWVGNEAGKSRENEWSVVPLSCKPSDSAWDDAREEDLGSRKKLNGAKYLYWYPAETDTPIREGWFYRDEKQYVKSVNELLDIWYRSVGNNSVLLLNLSPNKHGIIPKTDAVRIQELGKIIKESFSENLLEKVKLTDEKTACILDKDLEKSLQMSANGASLVFTFKEEQEFNRIMLQEDIRNFGQRIEQFSLEIWKNNAWQTVYKGGTVGYKKMGRFPMQKASKIKLQINKARLIPSLGFVGIYKAPELLSSPEISRNKSGMVSIVCTTPDPEIHYTLDGSLPTKSSPEYTVPFYLPKGGIVKAIAMVNNGNSSTVLPLIWART